MQITFKAQEGFYKEIFLNLFLIVITFGLYLPWGVTHIRKLVWSNVFLDKQRFYYLGEATEIVKGYLVLILLYMFSRIFSLVGEHFTENQILNIGLSLPAAIVFFTLLFKAQLGSFKYQAQRTAYKGIRFKSTLPGVGRQYLMCLRMAVFTVFSMGILYGLYYFQIEKMKYNSLLYGEQNFSFDLKFKRYAFVFFQHLLPFFLLGFLSFYTLDFIESSGMLITSGMTFLIIALSVMLSGTLFLHLLFSLFHLKINHFKTDYVHFSSDLSFQNFFIHNLLNIPILLLTLGLAFPVVVARNIGIYANSVKVHGVESVETIAPSNEATGFDEILSQTFDLDILDVF